MKVSGGPVSPKGCVTMQVSVCMWMIFIEYPFLKRLEKVAEIGFSVVEFWSWDNKLLPAAKQAASEAGREILTFQAHQGGTMINPEGLEQFVAGIQESFAKGDDMEVRSPFLLTGELAPDRGGVYQFPNLAEDTKRQNVLDGLKALAPLAEQTGIILILESLNTEADYGRYWLNHSQQGIELVREAGSPNIRLLYDLCHMRGMEGNLIQNPTGNLNAISRIHVADVPGERAG